MAFKIHLRNTKQEVYSEQAAIKLAGMLLAQDIAVERIEGPDGKMIDPDTIRRMYQSQSASAGRTA
jgi:hypothetical protein